MIEVRNGYVKIVNTWVRISQILTIAPVDSPDLPEYHISLRMKQREDPIEIKVSDATRRNQIIDVIVSHKGKGSK